MSFDLIYRPDFVKGGYLTDVTADLEASPNFASVAKAYVEVTPDEQKWEESMRLSNRTVGFAGGAAVAALMMLPTVVSAADQTFGVDNGAHITMWSRAATQARADALVQAYNASHKNHIDVTYVPTDDYQTKVGAAAAANSLPDLFSADVVFMPNWTSAGLFQDLTARIATLPFAANITQGAITASTWDGKKYGLPFVVDLSVWMYNKKLFKQAGLDPEKPPKSLTEFAADARAVAKLGGDVHGTFFGGDCGGCGVFTWWPIAWADGEKVMNPEGTESYLNSAENKAIYATFRGMVDDGTALMPDSKTETGPTWTGYFPKGKIGIMPMPASLQGMGNASPRRRRYWRCCDRRRQERDVDVHRRRCDRRLPR